MPGLIQHTSNQLDLLAERLCEVVSGPLDSPFTPEIVVVQSLASRRWLSFQIAQRQGICANYAFPFLGDFIAEIVLQASPLESPPDKMSTELLTWKIDALLPRCLERKEFAPVEKYLRDGDCLKRYHLAARLANLFDQYHVYRPKMVSSWASSRKRPTGDEAWQAALWRELGDAPGFDQALDHLRARGFKGAAALALPARVSIFAPTSLPPTYLDLLLQLGGITEVHLFLIRPSREYRGDDRTPKQRARLGLNVSDPAGGNPLVTSWGKVDADLTDLIVDAEERLGVPVTTGSEEFQEFDSSNLLGALKSDILSAHNRGAGSDDEAAPRVTVSRNDRSLVLNSCHSPMREVEVLYDQLLECFASMPGLRPRDIIVMTPEIEKYAPLVRGVFGYPENETRRIPYSLADRHPRGESLPIDTFLTLLDLPGSRYTAPQIFALLGSPALRHRFRFTDDSLSLIRDWIEETAIRWGIDAADRTRAGLPALDANTWRHGINRLLLGYGMEGGKKLLFEGILPHDEVEGDGAEILGRFVSATEALFKLAENFVDPRPLTSWVEPLRQTIEQFLDPVGEDELRDVRFLRLAIDRMRTLGQSMETQPDVDFRAVRQHLSDQLATQEQRGHFFRGDVTFCALKPVRSIPARVVCLLGINDQVFPRRPQAAQFDLMARSPLPGDPSARSDDRYSFLETLLSAREKLLISYVGRSAVHDKEIPPSVVVSELLEYLDQAFVFPGGTSAREFVLREHPLHAFSPRYFVSPKTDERFFSYSEANAQASRSIMTAGASEMPPFITGALPEVEESNQTVELRELVDFWGNPSRYFVKSRLGLTLRDADGSLDEDEPFEPTGLERYPIKQELLTEELEGGPALSFEAFQARGLLPPGVIGELQWRSMRADVRTLAERVKHHLDGTIKDEPVNVDLELATFRLSGRIDSSHGGRGIYFRPANLSPKDHLRAWIEHLALCALGGNKEQRTMLIGRDALVTFHFVSSAHAELQRLCERFQQGLTLPLPFFPASGMAFVEAEQSGKGDPFKKAREKWNGLWRKNEKPRGEKHDDFIERCFDGPDPLNERFTELARTVFGPMFQHATREEL